MVHSLTPITSVPTVRLIVGLAQGAALYLLYLAAEAASWPATNGYVFAPLFLIALFIPVIVLTGLANMRGRTLLLWAVAAALILAGIAIYDIWRGGEGRGFSLFFADTTPRPQVFPSPILILVFGLALFVAQSLVVASDAERKLIASYPHYFDATWKLAIQLLLSLAFIGVFWLLLYLGAGLFELVKLDFLSRLIAHRWFWMPATTLALACAIHVTDVRAGITRGIQTLMHTLLSWLLPVMALIVAGFLAALPFTGLDRLWSTRYATSLLLVEVASLILLINATYQDGQPEHRAPRPLRFAASLAAIALTPLVAIAAYALSLRVGQYGWTASRIITLACIFVGACYALGYLWAVIAPGPWLRHVETSNWVVSFLILGVVLALFTPIADPARISVADQVARLRSGMVTVEKFDFSYLRFEGARFGRAALESLKSDAAGEQAALITEKAEAALRLQSRGQALVVPPQPQDLTTNITVYPRDRSLPNSFARQDWSKMPIEQWLLPQCLKEKRKTCEAFVIDLDADGIDEILLIEPAGRPATVFKVRNDLWYVAGTMSFQITCRDSLEALRAGRFKLIPSGWKELEIEGKGVDFLRKPEFGQEKCSD